MKRRLKQWEIIVIVLASMAFIVIFNEWFSCSCLRGIGMEEVDRTDYAKVGDHFIRKHGFIANKLGKVTSIAHIGKGGGGGRSSFNVYSVRGTDEKGVCHITLIKTAQGEWFVETAELAFKGTTYNVPVKRSTGTKWKEFKLK